MSPTPEEIREFDRQLAASKREKAPKTPVHDDGGLIGQVGDAVDQARKAVQNPGSTAEAVVRVGVKAIAIGAFRGLRAAVRGISDAKHTVDGTAENIDDSVTSQVTIDQNATAITTRKMGWFESKRAELDDRVAEIANSKQSLGQQVGMWTARRSLAVCLWSMNTYPYIYRPGAWIAGRLKAGLARKTQRQGYATNYQKLRSRFYSIGPSNNAFSKLHYGAVNIFSAIAFTLTASDAIYNYAFQGDYKDVHVDQVNTQSSDILFEYKIDGYQIVNGQHKAVNFDIGYSIWYIFDLPRSIASEIGINKVCEFKTRGILFPMPVGLRRLLNIYPMIKEAHCTFDPTQYPAGWMPVNPAQHSSLTPSLPGVGQGQNAYRQNIKMAAGSARLGPQG